MKVWFGVFAITFQFLLSTLAYGQSTVIYQDDFEAGASGWSDSRTDFDPDTTRFLGPFDVNMTTTSRSFTVPAGSESLSIEFDLYRFDSWDNFAQFGFDRFEVEVNGTQLFSLPFPNPQAARSGTVGNVDWSHTPSTGSVELAYVSGQFWFDQIHRFELTVNNPGATVNLTLRAALSQEFNDESAAYDNFLVTAFPPPGTEITAVAESFGLIDGSAGGVTSSVLASDTFNNQPATLNNVSLAVLSSSSGLVSLDPVTGLISVAAGTPAGFYDIEYEICEIAVPTNCSSVTETVTVNDPNSGGGGGVCPVGTTSTPGTYHVDNLIPVNGNPNNPNGALGAPLAEGSQDNGSNSTGVTFFPSFIYDLTGDPNILVPAGETIDVSFANHFNSNPTANISTSLDNNNYTAVGSSSGPWTNNTFRYDQYVVPAGGARYLQVGYGGGGGLRFDGVIYGTQCQQGAASVVVTAVDDSETVTSLAAAQPNVLNVIDNDDFDGTVPTNFDLVLSAGSTLPNELTFDTSTGEVGVIAGAAAGVYSFDYDICDPQDADNCATATVTITIEAPIIEALAESFTAVDGASGGVTSSVLASDTLNGVTVDPADVTLTVGASDAELSLDPNTGFITVAAGTAAGTYTVEYTICDNVNPTNCATVTETVEVVAAVADFSITKTNTPGVNGDVDQTNDTLISGQSTTYTLVVTNNGPDTATGAVITDVIGAGLTCAATNAVTLSGDGVPAGSYTIADLTAAGIALASLSDGQSTTLSYSCIVN